MNPNETAELMETIWFVRDTFDMTILLIEHDMKLVSGICEQLTVLNFGQVLCQGETSQVLSNPEVVKAYLANRRRGSYGDAGSQKPGGLLCVIQALKGISFDVEQGEIVALIGANGAGKTTTLHTITGLLSAKAGTISYQGRILHGYGIQAGKDGHCPCAGRPPGFFQSYGASESENGRIHPLGQGGD